MMLFFVCGILHMLHVGYKYKHRSDFLSTERKYSEPDKMTSYV